MNLSRELYTPRSELSVFPAAAHYNLNDHESRNGGANSTSKKPYKFLSLASKLRKLSVDSLESVSAESAIDETPRYIEEDVSPVLQNIAPIRYELKGFDEDEQQPSIKKTRRHKSRRIKSTREPELRSIDYNDDIEIIRHAKPYRFVMESPADYITEEIIDRCLSTLEEKLASIPTKEKTELDLSFIIDEILNNVFDYTKGMNAKKERFHKKGSKPKTDGTATRDYVHEDTQPDRGTMKGDTEDSPKMKPKTDKTITRDGVHEDTQPERDKIKVDTKVVPKVKQKVKNKKRKISFVDPYPYIKEGLEYKHDTEVKPDSGRKGGNKARKIFKEYLFGESEPSSSGTTSRVFDNIKSFGHAQLRRTIRVCTMRRYPEKIKLRGREGYFLPLKCENSPCKSTAEKVCSRIFLKSAAPDTDTPPSRVREQLRSKVKDEKDQLPSHKSGGCHCCMRVPSFISNSPDPKRGCECPGELTETVPNRFNIMMSPTNTNKKTRIPGIAETDEGKACKLDEQKIRRKNPKICIQKTCPEVIVETGFHSSSEFPKLKDGDILLKGNIHKKGPPREKIKLCSEKTCPEKSGKDQSVSRRYSDETAKPDCVCLPKVTQTDSSFIIKLKPPRKSKQNADQEITFKSSHNGKDRTYEIIEEYVPVKDSLSISSKTKIKTIEICNRKPCPETVDKMKIASASADVKQEPAKKMISVCTQDTCPIRSAKEEVDIKAEQPELSTDGKEETSEFIEESVPVKDNKSTEQKEDRSKRIRVCAGKTCPEAFIEIEGWGIRSKTCTNDVNEKSNEQKTIKRKVEVCSQDTCPEARLEIEGGMMSVPSSSNERYNVNKKSFEQKTVKRKVKVCSQDTCPEARLEIEGSMMSVPSPSNKRYNVNKKSYEQKTVKRKVKVCSQDTCPEALLEIEGSMESVHSPLKGRYNVNEKSYEQKTVKRKVKVCSQDTCPEALLEIEGSMESVHSPSNERYNVNGKSYDQETVKQKVKVCSQDTCPEALVEIEGSLKRVHSLSKGTYHVNKKSYKPKTVKRKVRVCSRNTCPEALLEIEGSLKSIHSSSKENERVSKIGDTYISNEEQGKPIRKSVRILTPEDIAEDIEPGIRHKRSQTFQTVPRIYVRDPPEGSIPSEKVELVEKRAFEKRDALSQKTSDAKVGESSEGLRGKFTGTICEKKPCKGGIDFCIQKSCPGTIVRNDEKQGKPILERSCTRTAQPSIPDVLDEKIGKKNVISGELINPEIDESSKRLRKKLEWTICKKKPCKKGIDFCIQKSCPETIVKNDEKYGKQILERSCTQTAQPRISDGKIKGKNAISEETIDPEVDESSKRLRRKLEWTICKRKPCKKGIDFCIQKSCPETIVESDEKQGERIPRISEVLDENIGERYVIPEEKPYPKVDESFERMKRNLDVTICKKKPCERGIDFCIQKSCPKTVVDNVGDEKRGEKVLKRALYPKISDEALDENVGRKNIPFERTGDTTVGEGPERLKKKLGESTRGRKLDFCIKKLCPVVGSGDDKETSGLVLGEALGYTPEELQEEKTPKQSDIPTSPVIPTKSLSNTDVALSTTKTSDMEQNIQEILKEIMRRLLVLEEKAKFTTVDKHKATENATSSSDSEEEAIENSLDGIFHVCHRKNIVPFNIPSNLNVIYTDKNRPQFEISIDQVATFVVPLNEILASMLEGPVTLSEIEIGIVDRKKCQKRRCEAIKREVIVTILNYRLLLETEIFRKVSLSYGHLKMTL